MTARRGRAARLPALVAASVVLLAGCDAGTDDELQPRPTETVTVTGEPEPTTVPERLPFGDAAPEQDVIWAEGTSLRREGSVLDLGTITPETILVVPGGLLVLASGEVWFTAGQEAVGQAFAEVTSLGLSEDGTQVLVQPADRDQPVGYAISDGALVEEEDTGPARSADRVRQGPGDFQVAREGRADARVLTRAGTPQTVRGLPPDFRVSGWVDEATPYGLGAGNRSGTQRVHRCELATAEPSCRVVGPPTGATDPVFALHPAG